MSAVAIIGGTIAAVGAVGSGIIGSHAANSAAHVQADASNRATEAQMKMYDQTRSDLEPFMAGGSNAFSQLAQMFGFGGKPGDPGYGMPNSELMTKNLTSTPGYQFGLEQGELGLNRAGASGGRRLSGAQLQDAMKFNQGYAMQNAWQPYVSQLQWATGIGANAAAGVGNAGTATGQGVAKTELAGGEATAGGIASSANNWKSAFSDLGDIAKSAGTSYANRNQGSWNGTTLAPNTNYTDFSGSFDYPTDLNFGP